MYRISRFTSFIEKDRVYAVYCNFNLYFFKGITYKWFKNIIESEKIEDIDNTFIKYLLDNEIIDIVGDINE